MFKICIFCLMIAAMLAETIENKIIDDLTTEIADDKWDPIQKGQWIIAFFDKETKASQSLEDDWNVFALKCKEQGMNVGHVISVHSPGLCVRFVVTTFPRVFYVKNGVAHHVPKFDRESLIELIKNRYWDELKPVSFLSNPFSVQMSLLSHLFVHAINLYNYEHSLVQKFVSAPSATDIAFGLTFIVVGTILGLLMTCLCGLLQAILCDSKTSSEKDEDEKDEDKVKGDESSDEDDSQSVRKRK